MRTGKGTVDANRSAIAKVESVEPSSLMASSSGSRVWVAMLPNCSPMKAAP